MTGDAWDETDPDHPVAKFDAQGNRKINLELDAWLADLGMTYSDHQVILADPLELVSKGTYVAGVAQMQVRMKSGAPFVLRQEYPFTVRLIGTDGQQDDRTLWLKVMER